MVITYCNYIFMSNTNLAHKATSILRRVLERIIGYGETTIQSTAVWTIFKKMRRLFLFLIITIIFSTTHTVFNQIRSTPAFWPITYLLSFYVKDKWQSFYGGVAAYVENRFHHSESFLRLNSTGSKHFCAVRSMMTEGFSWWVKE